MHRTRSGKTLGRTVWPWAFSRVSKVDAYSASEGCRQAASSQKLGGILRSDFLQPKCSRTSVKAAKI